MSNITIKDIIDEDFVNFKVPSMTLMFPKCSMKCGKNYCQNYQLIHEPDISIDIEELCNRYINNPISEAVVCQGLEPMDSFDELYLFIKTLRKYCDDVVVIYTGYDEIEIEEYIDKLCPLHNIIIKFGRYIDGQSVHYDNILGVNLASDNQYAKLIGD